MRETVFERGKGDPQLILVSINSIKQCFSVKTLGNRIKTSYVENKMPLDKGNG